MFVAGCDNDQPEGKDSQKITHRYFINLIYVFFYNLFLIIHKLQILSRSSLENFIRSYFK